MIAAPFSFAPNVMDHAQASLAAIFNSPDFVRLPACAIFDEHDEFDEKGALVRRFDKAALEQIAKVCNDRAATSGTLARFGAGHTVDDQKDASGKIVWKAKEEDQPVPLGFVANYRVERFGPQQKWHILCDKYVKKSIKVDSPNGPRDVDGVEYVNSFPGRSIELWPREALIDWVAILRRTPARDLGLQIGYSRAYGLRATEAQAVHYIRGDGAQLVPAAIMHGGGKLRYAMGDEPERYAAGHKPKGPGGGQFTSSSPEDASGRAHDAVHSGSMKHFGDLHNHLKKESLKFHPADVADHLFDSGAVGFDEGENKIEVKHAGKLHDVIRAAHSGHHNGKPVNDLKEVHGKPEAPEKHSKERYAMPYDPTQPPQVNQPVAAPPPAVPGEMPQEEKERMSKGLFGMSHAHASGLMQGMKKKYGAEFGIQDQPEVGAPPAAAPATPEQYGAACASGSNTFMPEHLRNARDGSPDRYAALEAQIVQLQKTNRMTGYHGQLALLATEFDIDPAVELENHQDDTPEKFAKHLEWVRKYARQKEDPTAQLPFGPGDLQTLPMRGQVPGKHPAKYSKEQIARAQKIVEASEWKTEYNDALEQAAREAS